MGDILDDIDEAMAQSIAVGIAATAVGTWSMPEEAVAIDQQTHT